MDTIRDDSENTMEGGGADTLARDTANYQEDYRYNSYRNNGPLETEVLAIDNEILKLFPERVIKVSSFIDLLGSQISENTCHTTNHSSLNKSGSQSLIRLRNPIRKLGADVDFA